MAMLAMVNDRRREGRLILSASGTTGVLKTAVRAAASKTKKAPSRTKGLFDVWLRGPDLN
jgi:hypothetical protein